MNNLTDLKEELVQQGFAVINNFFTTEEINKILVAIEAADVSRPTFRKTIDLFAIRQFLKEVPEIFDCIFNDKLREMVVAMFGNKCFVVKSIYFDKPEFKLVCCLSSRPYNFCR